MAYLGAGVTPFRRVVRRIQTSEALLGLGETEQALDLLFQTGKEITSLNGPEVAKRYSCVRLGAPDVAKGCSFYASKAPRSREVVAASTRGPDVAQSCRSGHPEAPNSHKVVAVGTPEAPR